MFPLLVQNPPNNVWDLSSNLSSAVGSVGQPPGESHLQIPSVNTEYRLLPIVCSYSRWFGQDLAGHSRAAGAWFGGRMRW